MSVSALLDDFTRQEADYRFQSRTNLEGQRDQTRGEMEGAQTQGQGRTESMKPYQAQPVNYPSRLGAALRVGGDAAGGIGGYYNKRANTPKTPPTDNSA